MTAITTNDIGLTVPQILPAGTVLPLDISTSVTSWVRRGVFQGALFGFAFAAILVAITFRTDILAIGFIGTVLTAVFECAIITGGFAALAAALSTDGRSDAKKTHRTRLQNQNSHAYQSQQEKYHELGSNRR